MKQGFDEQSAIKIAYFRFALIAPVIQGTFADPTKTALMVGLCAIIPKLWKSGRSITASRAWMA